jgi:hypothetical protein
MHWNKLIVAGIALVATAAGAQEGAQEDDALELTMVLLPENATLPDAVTRVIVLPEAASATAEENAASGLDQANAARERREDGLENAAEASETGREHAQQNREDRGRGAANGPPEQPGPPDSPAGGPGQGGPPETPGPPGN